MLQIIKYFRKFCLFIFLLSSTLILINCDDNTQVKNNPTTIIDSLTSLGDTIFFSSGVFDIECFKGEVYLSDTQNDQIIVLDTLFKLQRIIGRTGSGPGEFKNNTFFSFYGDSLFVYDSGNNRINVYSFHGDFVRDYHLEKGTSIYNDFIIDNNGEMILSTPYLDFPLSIFNLEGKLVHQFGAWFPTESNKEKFVRNFRLLAYNPNANLIFSCFQSEPKLEIYTPDGSLLAAIDLSYLNNLKGRIKNIKNFYDENRKTDIEEALPTATLFIDIAIRGNYLYLQYFSDFSEKTISANDILLLKIEGNKTVTPKANIVLNHNKKSIQWFFSFDVQHNFIFTYDVINQKLFKVKL